ncbi:hypothetical protein ACTXT7_015483 [Hymenolepis weldensis]
MFLDKLIQIQAKYDVQMIVDKTVGTYAGGATEIEWLPVENTWQIDADGTATEALIRNISISKLRLPSHKRTKGA